MPCGYGHGEMLWENPGDEKSPTQSLDVMALWCMLWHGTGVVYNSRSQTDNFLIGGEAMPESIVLTYEQFQAIFREILEMDPSIKTIDTHTGIIDTMFHEWMRNNYPNIELEHEADNA
jgi:hypothetical protein